MDEGLSIHTNAAMDFPFGNDDAGAGERVRPCGHMIVNRVEESSIQVEQNCGIVRFPGFPRGRHFRDWPIYLRITLLMRLEANVGEENG